MIPYQVIEALRLNQMTLPDYLAQVEARFMRRDPSVQAFLPDEDRFARLHSEADGLLDRYPDLVKRPPLYGMTIGVKDIFHAEGFATQAGSRLPPDEFQGREAVSVSRLRNAGTLILGKTVTTEFAYFTPGPTCNPHNPAHTPGGSSSGSAAAVAAGMCTLALGTQTIGSVIRPAAFCGVTGFKPTYERISREGVIPLSPTLDHVGFFTPDVDTAMRVAPVLIEGWRPDTPTRKPVLGIPDGPYLSSASGYALACFNVLCQSLADAGYELRRVRIMDDFQEVRDRHEVIMSHDAAHVHAAWFKTHESLYSAKFTELVKRGQNVSNEQFQNALVARDEFRNRVRQAMNENQIGLWICPPAVGPAPKGLDSTGDPVMCLPWTQIGLPVISIPTTKNEAGLPMGLQLVGNWGADESLLDWAGPIEKVVREI